ncbi:12399_t:CDS:2 [Acaulospora morrowiae]|uniref:12399_t:CDS:1 n=1 Tax=Acaulospora morrowiae TaxID=94023 RepID=A0A9N9HS53_9GLOM|nr:12399_t:CDS:2 [Acaulospora morrowiae]
MSQLYIRVLLLSSLLVGLLALTANGATYTATVVGFGTTFTTTGTQSLPIPSGVTVYVGGQTLTAGGNPSTSKSTGSASDATGSASAATGSASGVSASASGTSGGPAPSTSSKTGAATHNEPMFNLGISLIIGFAIIAVGLFY